MMDGVAIGRGAMGSGETGGGVMLRSIAVF